MRSTWLNYNPFVASWCKALSSHGSEHFSLRVAFSSNSVHSKQISFVWERASSFWEPLALGAMYINSLIEFMC